MMLERYPIVDTAHILVVDDEEAILGARLRIDF
jgi:hypothetical protein